MRKLLLTCFMLFCCSPLAMAETGVVEVFTSPSGLNVYLDGIYVGHSPYSNPDINIGEHSISVSTADGTETQTWNFTVDELTPLAKWFYFQQPKPAKFSGTLRERSEERGLGNIQFASNPPGALVVVNGEELNKTPVSYTDVEIGLYNVSFRLNGKTLNGTFRVETDETGKLIADFEKNQIIDKWRKEKSKSERIQHAAEEKEDRKIEEEHERALRERLKGYSAEEQRRILAARDEVFSVVPVEYMFQTNRTYYYNAMSLNTDIITFFKLPYEKVTLEVKNLKTRESSLVGTFFEGDYVFRYGKHVRRGKFNSSDFASCRIKLYNDVVMKLRYDPDTSGYGKGEGRVFLSIR